MSNQTLNEMRVEWSKCLDGLWESYHNATYENQMKTYDEYSRLNTQLCTLIELMNKLITRNTY